MLNIYSALHQSALTTIPDPPSTTPAGITSDPGDPGPEDAFDFPLKDTVLPFQKNSIAEEPQSLVLPKKFGNSATPAAEGGRASAELQRFDLRQDIIQPPHHAGIVGSERERYTLKNLLDDDVAHGGRRLEREHQLPFLPSDAKGGVGGLPSEGDRLKPVLFYQWPTDPDEVCINDIWQGIGDCYFLGSVAAVVCHDPQRIKDMIVDNGDGTYTVTFKQRSLNPFKQEFVDRKITVTGDFPNGVGGKGHVKAADVTPQLTQEIWPLVLEKAYGVYLNEVDPYGTLDAGGSTRLALEAMTGRPASGNVNFGGGLGAPAKSFDSLLNDFQAGKAITLGTSDDENVETLLVPNHVYAVEKVWRDAEGREWVQLYNPWGYNHPAPMSFDEIRKRELYIA